MDYFSRLSDLLRIEKEEDRKIYQQLTATLPVSVRRENGMSWYPVAIRGTEVGRTEYVAVELERTTHLHFFPTIILRKTAWKEPSRTLVATVFNFPFARMNCPTGHEMANWAWMRCLMKIVTRKWK